MERAWVYSIKGYYNEYGALSLKDCKDENTCKRAYSNVDKACDGKRFSLPPSFSYTICPCKVNNAFNKELIPNDGVRF